MQGVCRPVLWSKVKVSRVAMSGYCKWLLTYKLLVNSCSGGLRSFVLVSKIWLLIFGLLPMSFKPVLLKHLQVQVPSVFVSAVSPSKNIPCLGPPYICVICVVVIFQEYYTFSPHFLSGAIAPPMHNTIRACSCSMECDDLWLMMCDDVKSTPHFTQVWLF